MQVHRARKYLSLASLAGAACLYACTSTVPPPLTPVPSEKEPNTQPLPPEVEQALFRVKGERIVTGSGAPLQLRGIAFGNEVWSGTEIPSSHHSGVDYSRIKKMGMNSVRFYLNYRTFEDDDEPFVYKEQGFAWLDQNIEWAKAHRIRLILNMHVPAGGFQSGGEGSALWNEPSKQERFVALWRTIAERYRAEPVVIGYDLLNEPAPTKDRQQWADLAQRTIDEIREVDQHHIIFVERVSAVAGDWTEDKNYNFVRVNDDNVVYEFHFYKPFHFTHQNASWSEFAARESWYPDAEAPEVDWYHLKTEAVAQSQMLPPGDSAWTMLETKPFVVKDEKLVIGKPFLVCDQGGGSAYFDSLTLTKMVPLPPQEPEDENGKATKKKAPLELVPEPAIETVFQVDLDTRRGWYFWTQDGKGKGEFVPDGHGDASALKISGTEGPANLGSDPLRFKLEQGVEYQLLGVVKGEGLGEKSRCHLRLEFYSSKVPVLERGKDYLRQELEAYINWGKREKVPLYLGEFGTIRDSFRPGRGGITWVQDMLALVGEHDLSFAYHTYHETPFGLFMGDRGLPSVYSANLPLYDAFVKALLGPAAQANLVPLEATTAAPVAAPSTEPAQDGVAPAPPVATEASPPAP